MRSTVSLPCFAHPLMNLYRFSQLWAPSRDAPAILQPFVNDLDKDVLCKPGFPLRLYWLKRYALFFVPVLVLVFSVLDAAVLLRLCRPIGHILLHIHFHN